MWCSLCLCLISKKFQWISYISELMRHKWSEVMVISGLLHYEWKRCYATWKGSGKVLALLTGAWSVVKVALVSSGNSQPTGGGGGGGGVVTEFFQAHRPSVLFVLSPANLVCFWFSGPQALKILAASVLFFLAPTNLVYFSISGLQT